jgi:hypothetical protein
MWYGTTLFFFVFVGRNSCSAFVTTPPQQQPPVTFRTTKRGATSDDASASDGGGALRKGDPVMLIGPGFLQLVLAKHLYRRGLRPIIVAPQSKLDSFFENLLPLIPDPEGIHEQLRQDSTVGMPEVGDPYFGELRGVVFCPEDAVLPPEYVSRVLDFTDGGQSAFANDDGGRPTRVVCCLPVSNKIQKERSNSWIPIFNNDAKQQDVWDKFRTALVRHPSFLIDRTASIVRFGSLFGGSYDGPDMLKDYGIDEGMYKVHTERQDPPRTQKQPQLEYFSYPTHLSLSLFVTVVVVGIVIVVFFFTVS